MSRRRRHQPDSLELLLDTMCNTFGGIIMIALLIALLSRDTNSQATTQNAEQQIEQIQKQIAEAERLQQNLQTQTGTNVISLLTQRDELRGQIEEQRRSIQSNTVVQTSITATNDPAAIQLLLAQLQQKTNQLQILTNQVARETQAHQRQLRLPREHVTGKRTFYFIARYSRFYPVHVFNNGARELNKQSLEWQTTPDGETAFPKLGAGMDVPALVRFLNDVPSATYSIHFIVFDDSFTAFLAGRQIPLARGYDTGWEFLSTDRAVIFSARGEAPPAL